MGTQANICVGMARIYFNATPYAPLVGNMVALSKVTVDVASGIAEDALTINTIVFIKKLATAAANHEFADAAGLVTCINDTTNGLGDTCFASAYGNVVTITSSSTITLASVNANFTTTQNDWTQFGFQTEEGCEFTHTGEFAFIKIAETNAKVKIIPTGEEAKLTFALQESDLKQISLLCGLSTYTAGTTPGTDPNLLTFGGKQTLTEYGIVWRGVGPDDCERIGYISRAVATAAFKEAFQKSKERTTPAEFEALSDSTLTAGLQLARIWEITSAA